MQSSHCLHSVTERLCRQLPVKDLTVILILFPRACPPSPACHFKQISKTKNAFKPQASVLLMVGCSGGSPRENRAVFHHESFFSPSRLNELSCLWHCADDLISCSQATGGPARCSGSPHCSMRVNAGRVSYPSIQTASNTTATSFSLRASELKQRCLWAAEWVSSESICSNI